MPSKTTINSTLIGIDAFGFVMLVIKWLSRAEFVQGLGGLVPLIDYQIVNWPAVYLLTCFISTSLLVGLNVDFILLLYIVARQNSRKNWDATDKNIITYIAEQSQYGETFDYENKSEMATASFFEAVRSGKLQVAARKKGEITQTFPKANDFDGLKFMIKNSGPNMGYRIYNFSAVREKDQKIIYESIVCDWRQVKKVWPPKEG